MASQKAAIQALLNASAAWQAIFGTTRTLLDDDLPGTGLTYKNAEKDADGFIRPHAVLQFGEVSEKEIKNISERRFFDIYLYEDRGRANIDTARRLLKTLLNRKQVTSDHEGLNFIHWIGGGRDFKEDELQGASASFVRFYIDYTNKQS